MNKYFKIQERGSKVRTEIIAGFTTFLAMAYILFVNTDILGATGMDTGAVFVATALAAAFGSIIMGLVANYPVALAPGMGVNAFFAFTVVLTLGYSWQQALLGVFISGILFLIITVTGLRKIIINAIPKSLKLAVGAGIGFFIAFIGMQNAGIVVNSDATLVQLGNISSGPALLAVFGLLVTLILMVKKVRGAIFIGMIVTSIAGIIFSLVSLPTAVIASVPSLKPTLFALFDVKFSSIFNFDFAIVIFTFLFIDFFDTAGTLMAVGEKAGLTNSKGEITDGDKALLADSAATIVGATLGTSTVTSYVESMTGIEEGGRTGLTAITTGVLFILAIFFSPLLTVVTGAVTAPALIVVGCSMILSLKELEWDDFVVTATAFLTIIVMVLSYSISEGIAVGFVFYPILMLVSGRGKKVSPVMYVLAGFFILYFIL